MISLLSPSPYFLPTPNPTSFFNFILSVCVCMEGLVFLFSQLSRPGELWLCSTIYLSSLISNILPRRIWRFRKVVWIWVFQHVFFTHVIVVAWLKSQCNKVCLFCLCCLDTVVSSRLAEFWINKEEIFIYWHYNSFISNSFFSRSKIHKIIFDFQRINTLKIFIICFVETIFYNAL